MRFGKTLDETCQASRIEFKSIHIPNDVPESEQQLKGARRLRRNNRDTTIPGAGHALDQPHMPIATCRESAIQFRRDDLEDSFAACIEVVQLERDAFVQPSRKIRLPIRLGLHEEDLVGEALQPREFKVDVVRDIQQAI